MLVTLYQMKHDLLPQPLTTYTCKTRTHNYSCEDWGFYSSNWEHWSSAIRYV